jgi:NADH:ubiquinone oxidoreductase subunit
MQLLSTLFIRLTSRQVGQDRFGNTYWEARGRRDSYGRPMRRVLYAKEAQASAVPAEWWGWLHHTTENPLPEDAPRRPWQTALTVLSIRFQLSPTSRATSTSSP